jgi:hypothetical protein
MDDILNNINTFRSISAAETIQQEDRLYRKLLSLKHSGFITLDEFQRCRMVHLTSVSMRKRKRKMSGAKIVSIGAK